MRASRFLLGAVLLAAGACSGGGPGDGDQAAFCNRLDRLTRNDPFLAFGDTATAGDIEEAFEALVEQAEDLVDDAPPEARAAAVDFAESASELDRILADADYDGTRADDREYREQQVTYVDAAARLERYLRASC